MLENRKQYPGARIPRAKPGAAPRGTQPAGDEGSCSLMCLIEGATAGAARAEQQQHTEPAPCSIDIPLHPILPHIAGAARHPSGWPLPPPCAACRLDSLPPQQCAMPQRQARPDPSISNWDIHHQVICHPGLLQQAQLRGVRRRAEGIEVCALAPTKCVMQTYPHPRQAIAETKPGILEQLSQLMSAQVLQLTPLPNMGSLERATCPFDFCCFGLHGHLARALPRDQTSHLLTRDSIYCHDVEVQPKGP